MTRLIDCHDGMGWLMAGRWAGGVTKLGDWKYSGRQSKSDVKGRTREGMKINIERTNLWPIKIPVLVRKGRWNVWTCHLIGRPSTPELLTKAVMVVVMWCGRDKLNEHWRMYLLPFSFRSHSTALLWPDRTTFPTAHHLPPLRCCCWMKGGDSS